MVQFIYKDRNWWRRLSILSFICKIAAKDANRGGYVAGLGSNVFNPNES